MTGFIDAPETPIERAARRHNTLHHHLDMPRRRREARVAAEGLLDVEVMAEVLAGVLSERVIWSSDRARDDVADALSAAVRAALLGEGA